MFKVLFFIFISNFSFAQPFTEFLSENLNILKNDPEVYKKAIQCTEAYLQSNGESFKLSDDIKNKITILTQNDSDAYQGKYFHYNWAPQDFYAGRNYYLYSARAIFRLATRTDYPSGIGLYISNDPFTSNAFGNVLTYNTFKDNHYILDAYKNSHVINKLKNDLSKIQPKINACSSIYFLYLLAQANEIHVVKYNSNWYYITLSKVLESQSHEVLDLSQFKRKQQVSENIFDEESHLHYQRILQDKHLLCSQLRLLKLSTQRTLRYKKELQCKH